MKQWVRWLPLSIRSLQSYTFSFFQKDLFAGMTVGIIAFPLAMAFAIASGVSPEKGLFTAIVGGFLISFLGGSRVQIGGPAGAFVILIYDILERTGYEGLAVSTLLASLFLLAFGFFRLGSWIKYIPHPLITGFTAGLSVVVFSGQIKDFLGLPLDKVPPGFLDKWESYYRVLPQLDPQSLLLGGSTLLGILVLQRFFPKAPWGICTIIGATVLAQLFSLSVPTIASAFGELPHSLPSPEWPHFNVPLSELSALLSDALAIALLGAIESLLSCVISDGMTGSRHDSNRELIGQGFANIGSILFGGIPATGAIARTATNVKSGAKTPIAGMIHALTILCIMAFCSSWVSQIPLAALAAVLMRVAWNMSDAPHFVRLMRAPPSDVAILISTFFLTILVSIPFAIGVGMVLASILFMKKMSEVSKMVPCKDWGGESDPDAISKKEIPEGVEVFEIQGPFFFGAADILKDLSPISPKVFILRMRQVPWIDASGMHALKIFYQGCQRGKIPLILSGVKPVIERTFEEYGLSVLIGKENICPHIDEALVRAEALLGEKEPQQVT